MGPATEFFRETISKVTGTFLEPSTSPAHEILEAPLTALILAHTPGS
jgi:hypothetical protein